MPVDSPMLYKREPYMPGYSLNQIRTLHACQLSSGIVSVIVGTIGLTLWLRMDKSRRMIFRLQIFFFLILADYVKALCNLCFNPIQLAHIHTLAQPGFNVDPSFCDGWGFMLALATCYSDSFIFCLTIHNATMIFIPRWTKTYKRRIVSYTNVLKNLRDIIMMKRSPFKQEIQYRGDEKFMYVNEGGLFRFRHALAATITIMSLLVCGLVFVNGGHYQSIYSCAPPQLPVWKRLINTWILKFTNIVSIVIVYTSIIIYLYIKLRKIRQEKAVIYKETVGDSNLREQLTANNVVSGTLQKELMDIASNESENKMRLAMIELKTFMIYPLCYLIVWAAPTAAQIYYYINEERPPPYGVRIGIALSVPFSCTMMTTLFLVREKPWNNTSKKLKKSGAYFKRGISGNFLESEAPYDFYENTEGSITRLDTMGDESRVLTGGTLTDPELDNRRRKYSDSPLSNKPSVMRSFMLGMGPGRRSSVQTKVDATNESPNSHESNRLEADKKLPEYEDEDEDEGGDNEYFLEFLRRGPTDV